MRKLILIISISAIIFSCSSMKYGYTEDLAFNSYMLITNNPKNFGNKRLKYNLGHHGKTDLYNFIKTNNYPDFIKEYEEKNKEDVIILFYVKRDSAYVFKEISNWNVSSILRERRKMTTYEHETFKQLIDEISTK